MRTPHGAAEVKFEGKGHHPPLSLGLSILANAVQSAQTIRKYDSVVEVTLFDQVTLPVSVEGGGSVYGP